MYRVIELRNKGLSRYLFITVLVFLKIVASSSAFACFNWNSLSGYQIIEVNNLIKFDCPIGGDYDCLSWPDSFYEWGHRCVNLSGFYGYGEEGILMSNGNVTEMVVIDGFGNSPSCYTPTFYNCPSRY